MAQGFIKVMGHCHWGPAGMFMLLPILELTYKGHFKNIFKDKLFSQRENKILPSLILSQSGSNWFCWEYYYQGCKWTQRIFHPAVQLFPQFSLHTRHHQTRGRDASLLTCPCVSTMIRSQPRTVCRRWAIVNIVQSANASLMVSWISKSVSVSIAAVASSRINIWKQHRILAVTQSHTFPPWI